MPPKRGKKAAAAAPATPALDGCRVALSGTFPGFSQSALQKQITDRGGLTSTSVTKDTTHLITTQADYDKQSTKVKAAKDQNIHIVNLEWLLDCLKSDAREGETKYLFGAASAPAAATQSTSSQTNGSSAPQAKSGRGRKRAASPPPATSTSNSAPQAKKKKGATAPDGADDAAGSATAKSDTKPEPVLGEGQVAKSKSLVVPLDEGCPYPARAVYIDGQGVIYDASLNQTNASHNNNKFYRIQVIFSSNDYRVWTRWGRVGEHGQTRLLGYGDLSDSLRTFEKKFREKSGLTWAQRGASPIPGKYAFVERSYDDDGDDDDNSGDAADAAGENGKTAPAKKAQSTLDPAIQELMQLIFNQRLFAAAMDALNYDAKKLPLGKLSTATITRGFQTLKELSALLDDSTLAVNYGGSVDGAAELLSNTYYSIIPHAFGRNRPPVIKTQQMVKQEIDLLDSLGDMKDAAKIMKTDKSTEDDIHPLDKQYQGLGMEEMTVLDPTGSEFEQLSEYLMATRGATHNANYKVENIFRIERNGEHDRFNKSKFVNIPSDRRLLWHGSRCTNFGGILSQGLRIAPPEAPVSGYMFDKGIYLADMSSKSANYCCSYLSDNTALLLLCEAELGAPMQELTSSKYDAASSAKTSGKVSTWGQGRTGPSKWKDGECVHPSLKGVKIPDVSVRPADTKIPNAWLLYNEYICYDVAQVRLRYLFRVKM